VFLSARGREGYAVLKKFGERPVIKGIKEYTKYENSRYHFSFKYPKNWRLSETEGRKSFIYIIHILGPRDKEDTHSTSLAVHVFPTKKIGGRWDTIYELGVWFGNTLPKYYSEPKEALNRETTLGNLKAREWEFSHAIFPAMFDLPPPSDPSAKTRFVITKRGPYLYLIEYQGLVEDYEKYFKAYERAKKSFRFTR